MSKFEICLALYGAIFIGVHVWRSIVQSKITETLALHRGTDDGESLTVSLSLRKGQSAEEKFKAIQEAFTFGEKRREFVDARFKANLEELRNKQDADHLKSV